MKGVCSSVLALGFAALAVAGCNGGGAEATTTTPSTSTKIEVKPYDTMKGGAALAKVGDVEITEKELEAQLNRANFQSVDEVTLERKKEALDKLIENELLYQEAKKQGLDQHPRVKLMMISLLQREAVGMRGNSIPPDDLSAYYEEHKEEYVIPEKVRARRILIRYGSDRNASKKKAMEVHDQAVARPSEFAKLARERGEGPEKARSGELGFFAATGRPGLDAKVVEAAFALDSGEVSSVFETEEGWNVIKVESRSPRTERSFEQVRKSVERRLLAERRKESLENYVVQLRNDAQISVNDDKLAEFTPELKPRPQFPKGGLPTHMGNPHGSGMQMQPVERTDAKNH